MMNGYRESDSFIVSKKPPNNACDNRPLAEEVEKRRLAKGNLVERNKGRTLNRGTLPSEPTRIRQSMLKTTLCITTRGRSPVH